MANDSDTVEDMKGGGMQRKFKKKREESGEEVRKYIFQSVHKLS